jgi:hypothetical protein
VLGRGTRCFVLRTLWPHLRLVIERDRVEHFPVVVCFAGQCQQAFRPPPCFRAPIAKTKSPDPRLHLVRDATPSSLGAGFAEALSAVSLSGGDLQTLSSNPVSAMTIQAAARAGARIKQAGNVLHGANRCKAAEREPRWCTGHRGLGEALTGHAREWCRASWTVGALSPRASTTSAAGRRGGRFCAEFTGTGAAVPLRGARSTR